MTLTPEQATAQVEVMLKIRQAEMGRLDKVHAYLRGSQAHPAAPRGQPQEVRRLAQMARVNVCDIVISAVAQAMYVEGYRVPSGSDEAAAWQVWQANRLDARQSAVHRAALAYGTSYATVLPGSTSDLSPDKPMPVIRGYSPRRLTAAYGIDDDDWPRWALRSDPLGGGKMQFRLYDANDVYIVESTGSVRSGTPQLTFVEQLVHGVGIVPVVRFRNVMDLDEDNQGEVEPLFETQDQIDVTTFELLVAQHYQSFRQRWIIGWTAADENALLKASAAKIWTFDDSPDDVKVGEFGETELKGYLESREASLKYAATLSQTPIHELTGTIANLSADALVAAEVGQRRKISERQLSFGEAWEQVLELAGRIAGFETEAQAQVRWRDTEARALSQTVDALGKMAQMLGVPPQMLWERIPGVSQADITRWQEEFAKSDALTSLTAMLQNQGGNQNNPAPAAA